MTSKKFNYLSQSSFNELLMKGILLLLVTVIHLKAVGSEMNLTNIEGIQIDSLPGFKSMYSYDDISVLEYDYLKVATEINDTFAFGKKQLQILSRNINNDSAVIDFKFLEFSFLTQELIDTFGQLRIYNEDYNDLPPLSTVCDNSGSAHLACSSNLSEWFQIGDCKLDFASTSENGDFGRLSKTGDGDFAYSARITEGLGYTHWSLTGSLFELHIENLVGFVEGDETIGEITDFSTLSKTKNVTPESLILFPNPTTGLLNIQTSLFVKNVSIYNGSGKLISSKRLEDKFLDLSELAPGIYFLEIQDGHSGRKVMQKFIIK